MHKQVENSNNTSEELGRVSTGDAVGMHAKAWLGPSNNNSFDRRLHISGMALRGATAVLCFLSMIIMAANTGNGDIKLHNVQSFVYLVVVLEVALAYLLLQLGRLRLCLELRLSRPAEPWQVWLATDFCVDQLCAYLLMSVASAAVSASTDLMQNVAVKSFTHMGAASVAMAFLAFFVSAASAAVSAFNFAKLVNWR